MGGKKNVFMFSGQGSQYFQMGRSLYSENAGFRCQMGELDEVVRALTGHSVTEHLYAPAKKVSDPFERTLLTHPAIIMVEYCLAHTLMKAGVTPDIVLGASLGSYTAASLAGVLPIHDALAIAVAHARSLEEHCPIGGMIAILADPGLFRQSFLNECSELAAVNFASHFVVSAPQEYCQGIEDGLRRRDIAFQRLPVSYAFHSRWIDGARCQFEALAESVALKPPCLPIVCCDHGQLIGDVNHSFFWDVTRQPIQFSEAIAFLEEWDRFRYIDVGPSGTLAVFMKYLLGSNTQSTAYPILTPYGRAPINLERIVQLP